MKNFLSQKNILNLLVVCLVVMIVFLGKAYGNNLPFGDSEMAFAFGSSSVSTLGQSCFKNWNNWASSTVYDGNDDWNFDLVPVAVECTSSSCLPNVFQNLQDINGDGLADFIFSYGRANYTIGNANTYRCIGLNNGAGWDVVYKCVENSGNYYGDCAG